MRRPHVILIALALLYGLVSVWPSWRSVTRVKHGRDYATYHYALAEAMEGGDPYDTKALSRRAKAEKTRRGVHPFFYPPPFLLGMVWAKPLTLTTGYRVFFGLTQLAVLGVLWVLQAPFLKIFEKFENFRISFIPLAF